MNLRRFNPGPPCQRRRRNRLRLGRFRAQRYHQQMDHAALEARRQFGFDREIVDMATTIEHLEHQVTELAARVSQLTTTVEEIKKQTELPLTAGLEARFKNLVASWKSQSDFLSSMTDIVLLPPYQEIIGMGKAVLPLLLHELQTEPDYWFWALQAITGSNPVPPDANGDLSQMTAAWLRWGRERGYCR